ncbi:hypothetical protein [Desulfoluna sp.]|uniref:hypothetical protein n=1 Tax=Desulfoluna sp. TaxID=2045199 RepID=UPI0026080A15|nr:hypothetical protein [Desulfoluna sp.]
MRTFHLRFFVDRPYPDGLEELLEAEEDELLWAPAASGAYVIGAGQGTMFTYPWGQSPIFWIGESRDLRKSFAEYRRLTRLSMDDRAETTWWPQYQYGASYGATVAWYAVVGAQFPNRLQYDLMAAFYGLYGSMPLGNLHWPSGLRPVHGE